MNNNKLINLQLIAIIGFIFTLILSFLLTYNEKLINENKPPIFDNNTSQILNLLRNILILIIALVFLYINYEYYISNNQNNRNDAFLNLESAILTVIVAIIGVYIAVKNYNKNINLIELEDF